MNGLEIEERTLFRVVLIEDRIEFRFADSLAAALERVRERTPATDELLMESLGYLAQCAGDFLYRLDRPEGLDAS